MPTVLFKKGKPKTGGRKPGVKNKKTVENKSRAEFLLGVMDDGLIEKAVRRATTGQLMTFYSDMLEYTAPKQARVDASGNSVTDVTLHIKRSRK